MACPQPLPPLLTPEELAEILGVTFDDAQTTRATWYLRIISGFVRMYACDDMVDPDDPDSVCVPDAILGVIISSYSRAINNPRGLTSERIADYQWTASPATGAANFATGLYLSNAEVEIIRNATGCGGLGTIEFGAYIPDQIRDRTYDGQDRGFWGRYAADFN